MVSRVCKKAQASAIHHMVHAQKVILEPTASAMPLIKNHNFADMTDWIKKDAAVT